MRAEASTADIPLFTFTNSSSNTAMTESPRTPSSSFNGSEAIPTDPASNDAEELPENLRMIGATIVLTSKESRAQKLKRMRPLVESVKAIIDFVEPPWKRKLAIE